MKLRIFVIIAALSLATVVLSLTLLGGSVSPAQASHGPVLVAISGNVSLDGLTLRVGAQASGPANSLTGQGFDTTFYGNPGARPPAPGTCTFASLSGSLAGGVVTLEGTVTSSSDPALVGADVSIEANTSTGAITFTFDTNAEVGGPFVLTGTGKVVVHE